MLCDSEEPARIHLLEIRRGKFSTCKKGTLHLVTYNVWIYECMESHMYIHT